MNRAVVAVAAGMILALAGVSGALAQEDEDEGDYGPTGGGGVPVEIVLDPGVLSGIEGTDSGVGQPAGPGDGGVGGGEAASGVSTISAQTSVSAVTPGGTVVVTAPAAAGAPAFQEGSTPTVGVAAGSGGAAADFEATLSTDSAGNVTVSITMPADTPTGLYYIFITGVNAAGDAVTYVADVTVSPAADVQGSTAPASAETTVVRVRKHTGPVPAPVRALLVTPAAEDEYVRAVVEEGAELRIEGTRLVLHRPADDLDGGRPMLAAVVIATIGGSLAMLRRRPVGHRATAR